MLNNTHGWSLQLLGHNITDFRGVDRSNETILSISRFVSSFSETRLQNWDPTDFLALLLFSVARLFPVFFFFYSFQLSSTFLALTLKSPRSARFAWPALGRHLWPRTFGQSAFTVLTINLNPSLNFLIFVAHGRHTWPEKLEVLSARIPVFRRVILSDNIVPFACLSTFCSFALIGQILTAKTARSRGEYWGRHSNSWDIVASSRSFSPPRPSSSSRACLQASRDGAADQCHPKEYYVYGMFLKGHTFKTVQAGFP